MEKQKILFVVNPKAGKGRGVVLADKIPIYLDSYRYEWEVVFTRFRGHASEIARKAVEEKTDVVVAVGGDGTVNEVAREVVSSESRLGIIPVGAGNGLARDLGIPKDMGKAISLLNTGRDRRVDSIRVNDNWMFLMGGVGFDARVTSRFEYLSVHDFMRYMRVVFIEYFKCPEKIFKIKGDGIIWEGKAFMVCIANASQFGYNVYIAPQASMDDGKVDICIVRKPRWYQVPLFILRLFLKSINHSSLYVAFRGENFTVSHNQKWMQLDGEPVKVDDELHVAVYYQSLGCVVN